MFRALAQTSGAAATTASAALFTASAHPETILREGSSR